MTGPEARCSVKHSQQSASFFVSLPIPTNRLWVNSQVCKWLSFVSFKRSFCLILRNKTKQEYEISSTHRNTQAVFKMPLVSAGATQFCLLHMWQKFIITLKRWLNSCVYLYFSQSHSRSITVRLPAGWTSSDAFWVVVFIWGEVGRMISFWEESWIFKYYHSWQRSKNKTQDQ